MKIAWQVDPADNVAVVTTPVSAGERVMAEGREIGANSDMPVGHKIALRSIPKGTMIVKYGVPIGRATTDIAAGDYVHVHNVEDITTGLCEEYAAEYRRKAAEK